MLEEFTPSCYEDAIEMSSFSDALRAVHDAPSVATTARVAGGAAA